MNRGNTVITREELANLPVRHYEGPIVVVGHTADLKRAAQEFRRERVVGFDTETLPSFRKGQSHTPTLVQVATAPAVFLFPLRRLDCSEVLTELLANPAVVKAGVALAEDLRKLKEVFSFEAHNIVDLGAIARGHGLKQSGVRNLAGLLLGFRVTKSARTSNWRRPSLSPTQIRYAATDAWVCRELFLRFEQLGWHRENAL